MSMRRASWVRRLRSSGGTLIRRAGLLPGGMPDGLGEDAALLDAVWDERVMVWFSETRDGLYQIEGWYQALRALDAEHGVVIVCQDSRTAAQIRADSGLTVRTVAQESTLEGLLARSAVALCLYVNNHPNNFIPLRFRSLLHVNVLHGDSDKIATVSNQVKAYDFVLVAGRAAVDRYAAHLPLFDADAHCIVVGRPQIDARLQRRSTTGHRRTVLYAPTWEGAGPTVAYGSVRSHGAALVRSLIDAGLAVIYRPHPLSGVRDPGYGEADAEVRAIVSGAAVAVPDAGHAISTERPIENDFADADLLVSDISAVTIDWLPTGRPIVVTTPATEAAQVASTTMLESVPRLAAGDAATAGELVVEQIESDPAREQRAALVEYYVGDTRPGASLRRFLDTCTDLVQRRDDEWRSLRERAGGSPP